MNICRKYLPLLLAVRLQIRSLQSFGALTFSVRKKSSQGIIYMQPSVNSKVLISIMNGDNRLTKMHLRLSAGSFKKIVEHIPKKNNGWYVEYEVTWFLYWMACGCSYRVVGGFLGISRFTARNIILKNFDEVLAMRQLINHGSTEDYERNGIRFCKKTKSTALNKFVGAIDVTHIRIKCTVNKHDEYINNKKYYSIQAQAAVDGEYKFTDVFIGYPGSVHDTIVFLNSPLYAKGDYPPQGWFLLGDKGYLCQLSPVAVITQFKDPLTPGRARLYHSFSKGRIILEGAFGMLKTRWRNIFNRELELKIENCIKTTFAAFILHKLCLLENDFDPSTFINKYEDVDFETSQLYRQVNDTDEGIRARNTIFEYFERVRNENI